MIYSIGTSNRSLPEFVTELQRRSIRQIIDIRSSPYSRMPWFNREQIARWTEQAGIMYREEGEALGGRAEHTPTSPVYEAALERIIEASGRETIAVFCAEGDPAHCHRSFEVGAALLIKHGIVMENVCRDGRLEDNYETLARTSPARIPASLKDEIKALLRTKSASFGSDTGKSLCC